MTRKSNIRYTLVVCTDLANGIGKAGEKLLWHVPEELRHFKAITACHPVVMGRRTFESIGKPLPLRQNIILTRNKDYKAEGCTVVHNIEELESLDLINDNVMVIGGAEIYKLFWDKATTIFQSVVQVTEKECDLFFPKVTIEDWELDTIQTNINYNFLIYDRK